MIMERVNDFIKVEIFFTIITIIIYMLDAQTRSILEIYQ